MFTEYFAKTIWEKAGERLGGISRKIAPAGIEPASKV